jgi:general secretion pathway protein A
VVLIIDEAQNLSDEALEQVRLLTNLETPTQKLLQIILLGQPELRVMLGKPELRQLAQRITARYHLMPLSEDETEAYVRHRLAVAGAQRFPFTKLALRRIHHHSGGVPRLINVIADRALIAGYAQDLAQIGERAVDQAAKEALASPIQRLRVPRLVALGVPLLLVAALAAWWLGARQPVPAAPAAASGAGEEIAVGTEAMPTPDLGSAGLERRILDAGPSGLNAWTRLLSLWMLRAEEADVRTAARCPLVLGPGVFCLRGTGSLTKLATLRRPVILRLSEDGREAWAVLLGIDEDSVRLAIGGDTFDTGWHALERAWLGEYYAIWRAPAFMAGTFRRGDSGPAVEWLERRLADARGEERPELAGPAIYDAQMEAEVRSLQAAHGLIPDGVVGPETLLALSSHVAGGPRLRRRLDP